MARGDRRPLQGDATPLTSRGDLYDQVRAGRRESSIDQLATSVRELVERQDTLNKDMVRLISEIREELQQLEHVTIELDRELTRVTRDLGELSVRVSAILSASRVTPDGGAEVESDARPSDPPGPQSE